MKRAVMSALYLSVLLTAVLLTAAAAADGGDWSAEEEQRERRLLKELRCLVCQNQSLADSNADLAKDMRTVVRDLLEDGRDDKAIIAVLTERYGDFITYKPPFRLSTAFLWLAPFVVLAGGLAAVFMWMRRRATLTTPLGDAQRREVQSLLQEDESDKES